MMILKGPKHVAFTDIRSSQCFAVTHTHIHYRETQQTQKNMCGGGGDTGWTARGSNLGGGEIFRTC
jgi:hypothetical protein